MNQNLNRFKADGKYYEGLRMGGRVKEVKDGRVTVDLDCLFLEFRTPGAKATRRDRKCGSPAP